MHLIRASLTFSPSDAEKGTAERVDQIQRDETVKAHDKKQKAKD
jgi:hypothetical protein